jgi:putative ABC transport system permease protein
MKNKIISLINIAGLSIGIAACLLILQYVSFELSYDQFNKNGEDIYRVVNDRYQNGKLMQHTTKTYSAISKLMHNDYPEVINFTPVQKGEQRMGDKIYSGLKIPSLQCLTFHCLPEALQPR